MVCAYLDHFTQTLDLLEQKSYGERMEVAGRVQDSAARHAQEQIVLVTLSDSSYESGGSVLPPGPFLPRSCHAELIRRLTRYGAKVIAFDLLFDTPQPQDAALADAVRRSDRVLLACGDTWAGQPELLFPEKRLLDAGARFGHTRTPVDSDRPALDRIAPVVAERGLQVPAFSVQAVCMAAGQPTRPPRRTPAGWRIGGMTVPVNADDTFNIRYSAAPGQRFAAIPYEEVLSAAPSQDRFFEDIFRNKIVVVGDTTQVHGDVHLTPLGLMPGVEVQAHAITTLLAGRFLRDAPWQMDVAAIFALAAAALLSGLTRLSRAAVLLPTLLIAYFLFNVWLFVAQDVSLHLIAPTVAFALTALGIVVERGRTEEQEKTRMRGLLQRYVSPRIAVYILEHPELLDVAGTRATGTVLFADIRDFTALSERIPPEELVGRMNEYFETMTDIIFRHDGTASSIAGDAMLALFGVPVPTRDHAQQAVAAAIEMQNALMTFQERWRTQDFNVFEIGIGINTGEMVVGNVGGRQLTNFTVYGLQVNIASRVEGLNKEFGSRILITRATQGWLRDDINLRGPLRAFVKGMADEIEVFEVLTERKEPADAAETGTSGAMKPS